MLGFKSAGSLASMKSNFRRGLRLAGVSVMPGKSHAPLSDRWVALREAAELHHIWAPLSRFVHFCAERGVEPDSFLADELGKPLREATRKNYLGVLRRVAGELVATGVPADELRSLADLVRPDRVKLVLTRIAARTRRQKGGHVGLVAFVLYVVARDHARVPEAQIGELKKLADRTRSRCEMGQRTECRLEAMSGGQKIDMLLRLPDRLLAIARKREKIDATSAGHVRAALFLNLLLDMGARQGNVVGLDLARHLVEHQDGNIFIIVPGQEVKNGQEIRSPVRPRTAKALRLYRDSYRAFHAGESEATWLFPRADGSHWPITAANRTLQDLTAKHIGFPVNPHLVRALIGEIVEDEHPGAVGMIKDLLGHRLTSTTETYYRGRNTQRARQRYHAALDRRVKRR